MTVVTTSQDDVDAAVVADRDAFLLDSDPRRLKTTSA